MLALDFEAMQCLSGIVCCRKSLWTYNKRHRPHYPEGITTQWRSVAYFTYISTNLSSSSRPGSKFWRTAIPVKVLAWKDIDRLERVQVVMLPKAEIDGERGNTVFNFFNFWQFQCWFVWSRRETLGQGIRCSRINRTNKLSQVKIIY
jgi:hypothetical protein